MRSREKSFCPWCQGTFRVVGSRKRKMIDNDGSVIRLMVRRLQCTSCSRISHELPDLIVPYKRHAAATITKALTEPVTSKKTDTCCENSTIRRWKLWFFLLRPYLEDSVRALMELFHCQPFINLPLYPLETQSDGWLELLVRNLVNSGRWRQTRSA